MKKIVLFLMICTKSFSQENIYTIDNLIFYGYDYLHFQLIEPKRAGQEEEIKMITSQWTMYLADKHNWEYYYKILKWNVAINYSPTLTKIKDIKKENILGYAPISFNPDSIDSWIANYKLPDKKGIGYMCFIEYLYKADNTTSMWFVFFDIATRKILLKDHYQSNKADGHGLGNYWGEGIKANENYYLVDVFKKIRKSHLK